LTDDSYNAHDATYSHLHINVDESFGIHEHVEYNLETVQDMFEEQSSVLNSDLNPISVEMDHCEVNEIGETETQQRCEITEINNTPDDVAVSNTLKVKNLLETIDYEVMRAALSIDDKALKTHDWKDMRLRTLMEKFQLKEVMNKFFQKHKLQLCLRTIKDKLKRNGIHNNSNWPKYKIIDLFVTDQRVEHSNDNDGRRKMKPKRLISLKEMCTKKFIEDLANSFQLCTMFKCNPLLLFLLKTV